MKVAQTLATVMLIRVAGASDLLVSASSKLEKLDIRWIMSQVTIWWEKYQILNSRHILYL